MVPLPHFRFWCQKVLPLVYEDSLSYYEVLCKTADYINNLISNQKDIIADVDQLQQEMQAVDKWIADFEPTVANEIIEKYIARGVYFGLSDAGYFVTYIPQSWKSLKFNTTGLDIQLANYPQYGRLVISY